MLGPTGEGGPTNIFSRKENLHNTFFLQGSPGEVFPLMPSGEAFRAFVFTPLLM